MERFATMRVWNVDLGLAVHVEAPNNRYMVIDMGSSKSVHPMRRLMLRHVDYMVITHPHQDHFSDIESIFKNPKVLWHTNAYTKEELLAQSDSPLMKKYIALCEGYGDEIQPQNNPANGILFRGMEVKTFWATKCDKSTINNASAVVVARLGTAKVVICGDNQKESLEELMLDPEFVVAIQNAQVLVAPHHGRETGYVEEFVKIVNPRLTIISDTIKSESSAVDKYSEHSEGYIVVNSKTGEKEQRECLTTRKDGNIEVRFGYNDSDPEPILWVNYMVD